jgi:hypothetical protein
MITATPTAYSGLYTAYSTRREDVGRIIGELGATPAAADPKLAWWLGEKLGPTPLPSGLPLMDRITAAAVDAGVPAAAVLWASMAIIDAVADYSGVTIPPQLAARGFTARDLAAVKLPPVVIFGNEEQCGVVVKAAEAVVASTPGGRLA